MPKLYRENYGKTYKMILFGGFSLKKSMSQRLKTIFLFSPKEPKDRFVLDGSSKDQDNKDSADTNDQSKQGEEVKDETRSGEDEKRFNRKANNEKRTGADGIKQPIPINEMNEKKRERKVNNTKALFIDTSLNANLDYIKARYNADINGDFKIREFKIIVMNKDYPVFVCFFDGMIDRLLVNMSIIQPLMTLSAMPVNMKDQTVRDVVYNHLIPQNQVKVCKTYQEIVDEVNFGGLGIFVDGLDVAFACDVKGWEHRNIEKPTSELNIRGPKESFNETNRMNTALLRKIIKDENLIVEDVLVGERSKTPCSMVYIKNIVNDSLVGEVRRRLKSIKTGYLRDSGELEQFLEDSTYLPAPQMLLTERPDRVASYLGEGRVGIIVHGSPFVIIAPVTLFNLIHSPEDYYLRYPYATLLRFIRILGVIFTLLLPSLYLAITNYHHEMLPTDLLLAIASAREKVPFPTVISIFIMEIAFELIREAGIRIPGPIGPTLSIVGALILGQAAVAANLVSPILIIIVAVTAIGSFSIPDFSLGYSFRALRFIYLLLAGFAGLLGITLGIFLHLLVLVHAKSFGVPFMAPFAPRTSGTRTNAILKTPLWKEEDRPDFVNPKDIKQQAHISRGWIKRGEGANANETEDKDR